MDRVKFNNLAKIIAKAFGTNKQLLFERSKQAHIVQPRHILWLVASKNNIRPCRIEAFTKENGLNVCHSTVTRGIDRAKLLVKTDERVQELVESLKSIEK